MPETNDRELTRRCIGDETDFLVDVVFARKGAHVYRRGNEFQFYRSELWDCPLTTVVTFLQTTAAMSEWPVDRAFRAKVLATFDAPRRGQSA